VPVDDIRVHSLASVSVVVVVVHLVDVVRVDAGQVLLVTTPHMSESLSFIHSMMPSQLLYPDDVLLFFALLGGLQGVDHLILLDQDHQGVLTHSLERAGNLQTKVVSSPPKNWVVLVVVVGELRWR
jgi:hypothetical protein